MAYAALLSLSHTIELILSYHRDSISPPAKDQIVSISEYAILLQAFLEDCPDEARRFEAMIRALTLAAEDVIEFFMSEHVYEPAAEQYRNQSNSFADKAQSLEELIRKARHAEGVMPSLLSFLPSEMIDYAGAEPSKLELNDEPRENYKHLPYDFQELKEAKEEIESIAQKVMKFKNCITVNDIPLTAVTSSSTVVSSSQKDVVIVGFEDDLMDIKSLLCRESSNLEVVPIVGMGGIGKTTLARNVYDDQSITEHFDIRAWVTVSQDYSIGETISSLLASMKVFTADSDLMKRRLLVYQHLKCRRFFIVLDDIWSIDVWDDLNQMFPDDGNGSRIMLTTRLQDVASYADSSSLMHKMHLMNKDQGWNLLQQLLFKHDPCPIELENIGKVIARRCRGLPLAIVVISGILSTVDPTEAAWSIIAENVKSSAISANEEQLDKILSLSYAHLPHYLRPCFLYIAGFPEDYEMRVSRLIRLWIAEGFLKPSRSKSLEETGEEYLDHLVKRSLVSITKQKTNGGIKRLSMHDLIREMCIRKSQQENCFHRYLRESRKIPLSGQKNCLSTIRTTRYLHDIQQLGSLGYYKLLRILDLQHLHPYFTPDPADCNLPPEICELFHLRYLAFDCQFRIPTAISKLQNLQTFIIYSAWQHNEYAYNANAIPFLMEIWSMPQLRHIHIGTGFFFCLPSSQGGESFALENLQTLSLAINFVCTSDILKAIPNLKKLSILFTVRDDERDYHLDNLMYLEQLENLKLEIYNDFPCFYKVDPSFPSSLKKLTLRGLELPWEDLTIVGSLPNLQVLKLQREAYIGGTWETTEGEFPQLKFLLIDYADLQDWITESSHFPRLETLVLYRCPFLSEIPNDIGEIPTLELIEVDKGNSSLVESAKQIQESQQDCGNYALRVRIVKALPFFLSWTDELPSRSSSFN